MVSFRSVPPSSGPPEGAKRRPEPSLEDRAASDLGFIRSAMERSGRFTAVPGWGGVFMGTVGLCAGAASWLTPDPRAWLVTWFIAAAVAIAGGAFALERKATRTDQSLLRGHGLKFLLGLCPALLVGAVLTFVFVDAGHYELLPETWLLLYGAAVVSAGATSVPAVPLTGGAFLLLGLVAALAPDAWGTALLTLGFGIVHWISGALIARSHGG